MSNGELYTILVNKAAKGKRGSILGIFSGTKSDRIIDLIQKHFPENLRHYVKEVSLDLAASMNLIASMNF